MVPSISTINGALPLKSYFANANPPSDERVTTMVVCMDARNSEFTSQPAKPSERKSVLKLSNVNRSRCPQGRKMELTRSSLCLNEAQISQKNGIKPIIAASISNDVMSHPPFALDSFMPFVLPP